MDDEELIRYRLEPNYFLITSHRLSYRDVVQLVSIRVVVRLPCMINLSAQLRRTTPPTSFRAGVMYLCAWSLGLTSWEVGQSAATEALTICLDKCTAGADSPLDHDTSRWSSHNVQYSSFAELGVLQITSPRGSGSHVA